MNLPKNHVGPKSENLCFANKYESLQAPNSSQQILQHHWTAKSSMFEQAHFWINSIFKLQHLQHLIPWKLRLSCIFLHSWFIGKALCIPMCMIFNHPVSRTICPCLSKWWYKALSYTLVCAHFCQISLTHLLVLAPSKKILTPSVPRCEERSLDFFEVREKCLKKNKAFGQVCCQSSLLFVSEFNVKNNISQYHHVK